MPPLVTAAQFNLQPDIQRSIQGGLVSRQAIQQEENRRQLAELSAQQAGTRQRALGVPEQVPEGETQGDAELRLIADNPEMADKLLNVAGIRSQAQREDAARFASQALNATTPELRIQIINQRAQEILARGGDASQTLGLLDQSPEEQTQSFRGLETAALTALQREQTSARATAQRGASTKSFAPVTLVNPNTGEKILATPTFDPRTNRAKLEKNAVPAGFELSKETPEEKRAAELFVTEQKEGKKVTGKSKAQRRQGQINTALDVADGFSNLIRARTLLESVETGGIDAASLRAKQIFGIESADEAELSNRLGKAVLSQLRTTFGAQFTEREGALLSRIEAGFGKSVEGNKRQLEQTIKIVERVAKRGIRAAEASGDVEAEKEIRDALEFRFTDVSPEAVAQPTNVGRFTVEVE